MNKKKVYVGKYLDDKAKTRRKKYAEIPKDYIRDYRKETLDFINIVCSALFIVATLLFLFVALA
jgi:hypothetical protein